MYTREQIKKSLQDHMEQVEKGGQSGLLKNPEYRTAASLLSIMEKQDKPTVRK